MSYCVLRRATTPGQGEEDKGGWGEWVPLMPENPMEPKAPVLEDEDERVDVEVTRPANSKSALVAQQGHCRKLYLCLVSFDLTLLSHHLQTVYVRGKSLVSSLSGQNWWSKLLPMGLKYTAEVNCFCSSHRPHTLTEGFRVMPVCSGIQ